MHRLLILTDFSRLISVLSSSECYYGEENICFLPVKRPLRLVRHLKSLLMIIWFFGNAYLEKMMNLFWSDNRFNVPLAKYMRKGANEGFFICYAGWKNMPLRKISSFIWSILILIRRFMGCLIIFLLCNPLFWMKVQRCLDVNIIIKMGHMLGSDFVFNRSGCKKKRIF